MNIRRTLKTTTITAALVAALTITGCAAESTGVYEPTPAPWNAPSVEPTTLPATPDTDETDIDTAVEETEPAEPVSIAGDAQVGDAIDAETAAALNDSNEMRAAYPLDDGRWIIVEYGQPIPQAVQDQVQKDMSVHDAGWGYYGDHDVPEQISKMVEDVKGQFEVAALWCNADGAWGVTKPGFQFGLTHAHAVEKIETWKAQHPHRMYVTLTHYC